MGRVTIDKSMSLDGYITGENLGPSNPLGEGPTGTSRTCLHLASRELPPIRLGNFPRCGQSRRGCCTSG